MSSIEPKKIDEALKDVDWVNAMHEELNKFQKKSSMGVSWEAKGTQCDWNQMGLSQQARSRWDSSEEQSKIGSTRLHRYTQVEGLDFGEIYALVARLEAIRILLAYACAHDIKLYQMDVKSAYLNGYINALIYVEQRPGFEDEKKPTTFTS